MLNPSIFVFLCLLFQLQKFVSSVNVVEVSNNFLSHQLIFPRQKAAKNIKSFDLEVKSPDGKLSYKVKCETYDDVDAKADVYTQDWVFIESLTLANVATPCDKAFIEPYISPMDHPNKGKASSVSDPRKLFEKEVKPEDTREVVRLIYLMRSKTPRCVRRTYTITRASISATVLKSDYPVVECPDKVTKFIAKYNDYRQSGGVVNLSPAQIAHDMEYNQNLKEKGQIMKVEFPKKDLKGKKFFLNCREDKLIQDDPVTKLHTVMTATIEHEDRQHVVLEKFKLNKCSLDFINVNRRIENNKDLFKIVYKTAEARCFERTISDFYEPQFYIHYNQYSIRNDELKPVACPQEFVGDINMNAWLPWYKRILSFLITFRKPFEEEVNNQSKKKMSSSTPGSIL